jgi:hypothetical protein
VPRSSGGGPEDSGEKIHGSREESGRRGETAVAARGEREVW